MLTNAQMEELMQRARATNLERDRLELEVGLAPPHIGGDQPANWLRTMISALEAGLRSSDTDAIAEGLAMLVDFEESVRNSSLSPGAGKGKFEPWKRPLL